MKGKESGNELDGMVCDRNRRAAGVWNIRHGDSDRRGHTERAKGALQKGATEWEQGGRSLITR